MCCVSSLFWKTSRMHFSNWMSFHKPQYSHDSLPWGEVSITQATFCDTQKWQPFSTFVRICECCFHNMNFLPMHLFLVVCVLHTLRLWTDLSFFFSTYTLLNKISISILKMRGIPRTGRLMLSINTVCYFTST